MKWLQRILGPGGAYIDKERRELEQLDRAAGDVVRRAREQNERNAQAIGLSYTEVARAVWEHRPYLGAGNEERETRSGERT